MPAAADDAGAIAEPVLTPGELSQQGRFLLRDWREPTSGITLFRIEAGYSIENGGAKLDHGSGGEVLLRAA